MVILGLRGSNKGERAQHLQAAVTVLAEMLTDIRCSPVYESPALLPEGAPAEWNTPFLNMAVGGKTSLAPHALLAQVKALEQELGRKAAARWSPREIDIDILAWDEKVMAEGDLTIPHAGLLMRDFALIPLADIAPDWLYPEGEARGMSARALAERLSSNLKRASVMIT